MAWSPRTALAALFAASVFVLLNGALARTAAAAERCANGPDPSATVYLPNVTRTLGGPAGWVTPIYVQNAGGVQTDVELSFLRFRDGALVACHRTAALAPGTSLVDNPNADADLPDDTQFSVVVRSYGAPITAIVNQLRRSGDAQQALAYTGFTRGDLTVYLPNVTRRFYGYDVPFIVQNLGTTDAAVSARFLGFDGESGYVRAFTVAPGRSYVVDPDFEPAWTGAPNSGLVDGTQYAVTLTASQPIAVVVNAHNEAGAPVAFSHGGIGRGATTLYAPYAAKGAAPGNTFSPIVVQNLGTVPTDAELLFASLVAGAPVQRFTLRAIPPGGARAFDPRFALGTTTPCDVASETCLGPGEYSLTITAPSPVAAVVLPNSATTAAAYLASPDLGSRVLLPVAFRRIGGWSTRVAVYTGAAAQLTARAYAIPSGDLAATFAVPIGAAGWTTFDLGAVAGLSDQTQYALTLDGGATALSAVALERGVGGDAFMAVESTPAAPLDPQARPASIRVTPAEPRTYVGWTQPFAASVKDQFGQTLSPQPAVTWTLAPATLGSLSSSGVFTAASTPGSGTLSATAGAVTTRVGLSVSAPRTVTLGGLSFSAFAAEPVDVYTQTTVGIADTQTVVTQADADVARIQTDYARSFAERPAVYVLGSTRDFVTATQTIGGFTSPPPTWASGVCVCREPNPSWVFVDWSLEASRAQPTTVRHELTHAMEREAAGPSTTLPAWFNEGNARVEEFTVAGTRWMAALERYRAASMAARGSLFTLDELTSQVAWSRRSSLDATYQYAVSAQAVLLLRSDIGLPAEQLLFTLMRQGQTFDAAYQLVAGRPLAAFADAFPARVLALAPRYPGVATAPDSPGGPGLTFVVYGLPPGAVFVYEISGPSSSLGRLAATDGEGVFYTYLDERWPAGSYTLTATWSGGVVSGSGQNGP